MDIATLTELWTGARAPVRAEPWPSWAIPTLVPGLVLYPWVLADRYRGREDRRCHARVIDATLLITCGSTPFIAAQGELRPALDEKNPLLGIAFPVARVAGAWIFDVEESGGSPDPGIRYLLWKTDPPMRFPDTELTLIDKRGAWAVTDHTPRTSEGSRARDTELSDLVFTPLGHPLPMVIPTWPLAFAKCAVVRTVPRPTTYSVVVQCGDSPNRITFDGAQFMVRSVKADDTDEDGYGPADNLADAPDWVKSFQHQLFNAEDSARGPSTPSLPSVVHFGGEYWLNHPWGIFSTSKSRYVYTVTESDAAGGAQLELTPPVAADDCRPSLTRLFRVPKRQAPQRVRRFLTDYANADSPWDGSTLFLLDYRDDTWVLSTADPFESPSPYVNTTTSPGRAYCFERPLLSPVPPNWFPKAP
jgi:hypothetical protein